MGVASPELMIATFAERFNAGDAEGFALLYTDTAIFTYDGIERAVGRKQIEAALRGFTAAGLTFSGENVSSYVVGDTALTRNKWELRDAAGVVVATGISAEVQRQGADGKWRFIIDDSGGGSRV